jgi:hypothetical protein
MALVASAFAVHPLTVAGCSKPASRRPQGREITTGRTLGPDGMILEDARTGMFWTTDTFYVMVQTDGSAENVNLQARWTGPDGQVAAESSKTISPKGTTTTVFEAAPSSQKDGRWPPGDYKLEILVNGSPQGSRDLNAR